MSVKLHGTTMDTHAPLRVPVVPAAHVFAWGVGFVVALWFFLQWDTGVHNDFTQNVWLPARLIFDGANTYYPAHNDVDTALGGYSTQFETFNSGTDFHAIYPIWLYLIFSPFAALPLTFSLALWRAANLLLLVWGIVHVLRSSNPAFRSWRPAVAAATGLTVLLCLLYRDSFLTLYLGQFSIIEFGLLVGIWRWLISSEKLEGRHRLWGDGLVGLGLAVLATKPQSVGLPVVLLGLWALSRRRWTIPAVAIPSLALLLLVPTLFYPSSLSDWLYITFGWGQARTQVQVSSSVWGLAYEWLPSSVPWVAVAAALSVLGIIVLLPRWRRDLLDKGSAVPLSLPLTICMNSVISPYMLRYEHVLLFIPALVLLAAAGLPDQPELTDSGKWWRLAIYTWLGLLPWLVISLQIVVVKEYMMVLPAAVMLAVCWIAKLEWKNT